MVDDTILSKQAKTTRSLPAANQKAAGFSAFRPGTRRSKKPQALGSASASGSATAPPTDDVRPRPKPQGVGRSVKNDSFPKVLKRHDPGNQANISHPSVSESRVRKKRKIDEVENIQLEDDEGTIEVLNSGELRNTGTLNKACTLVRTALAKTVEGEKERLSVETRLRQQIISLKGKLQQEKKDHDDSKRHIRDLERGLLAAASSIELSNTLIQATATQLVKHADVDCEKDQTET